MKLATALAAAILCLPMATSAATITSYNISSAFADGEGGWRNTYNGVITPAGTSATAFASGFQLNDLTGQGSGTLNDSVSGASASLQSSHLLSTADNVVIELFFDTSYFLSSVDLFSFNDSNLIPGSLTGFVATWSNGTASFTTTQDAQNTETASFASSTLDGVAVSSLTLSNFTTNGQFFDFFAISEVSFDSTPVSPVPLPASGLLLVGGMAGLLTLRRRKRAT